MTVEEARAALYNRRPIIHHNILLGDILYDRVCAITEREKEGHPDYSVVLLDKNKNTVVSADLKYVRYAEL